MEEGFLLDKYTEIKDCIYKDEHYSVRDNGAVLRHARKGKRKRENDDIWTFGKPNKTNGYMTIAGQRVHRIVAYAFLGKPPTLQHVVDHIDTNRRNNRQKNLRWLTRLENVLKNPITRARIENICGSIDAFLANPAILRGHESIDPNFSWMRTVSPEEAQVSLERLTNWAKEKPIPQNGIIDEWIFTPQQKGSGWMNGKPKNDKDLQYAPYKESVMKEPNNLKESLTPNAVQRYWRTPTEFPLCPFEIEDKPLTAYLNNLKKGAIVTKNQYVTHFIDNFALCNGNHLVISTHTDDESTKKFSMITITFEEGKYIHEATTFFEERGAQKALSLAQGLEWNGENGVDDYC